MLVFIIYLYVPMYCGRNEEIMLTVKVIVKIQGQIAYLVFCLGFVARFYRGQSQPRLNKHNDFFFEKNYLHFHRFLNFSSLNFVVRPY